MKIVILTQYFLPEMGAPQNRLFELAKAFRKRGSEVSIVTAMPNYPTGKIFPSHRGRLVCTETIEDLQVKRYWIYASNSARIIPRVFSMVTFSLTALFSVLFIRKKKPDFLLVESPPLLLVVSGWLLAKFSGAKMIMNVSDLWPLSAKELGAISDGMLYRWIEKLERFLYRRADLCTGQSQEIVDHIRMRTTRPVYLFRNGVDTNRFAVRTNTRTTPIRIVYAGLLGIAQGIYELCKAVNFASLGVELHIYGTGFDEDRLRTFLTENPNRGIRYFGVLPRDQMPGVLQQYDATLVVLVKNIFGAVPSKIYESMAAGLPIFFSGDGEGARIVEVNQLGWVNDPCRWNQLSDNLVAYANMTDADRVALSEHCRAVAMDKFDRTQQTAAFHSYLQSLLNS